MTNFNKKTLSEPFNIKNIIAMLAASPERDYEVIARMASKLVSEDTIDLTHLGNDLTLTDKKQMLGVTSNKRFDDWDVIQLIEEKGVNSPEYEFALERRLRLTLKQILQGVKKKHDKEDKRIMDSVAGSRLANFNTWANQRILSSQDRLSASLTASDRQIFESIEVKLGSEDPYVEEDVYLTDISESPEETDSQEDYSQEHDDWDELPF